MLKKTFDDKPSHGKNEKIKDNTYFFNKMNAIHIFLIK